MTEMRHEVSFQDFPCTALEYTRSIGLAPDKGSVQINLEDLGQIRLYPVDFRFRSTTLRGYESGMPMAQFVDGQHTVTARPPLESRGEGLNEFGELVIQSYVDGNKAKTLTYHDIYVDTSGLEEITDDLANVLNHDEGVVKVPLTDIRQFYAGHSPVYQRINCHLPSGRYDPTSIYFSKSDDFILMKTRKIKGVPFTADQVFRFLFGQLPGSPPVSTPYGVDLKTLPDPQDIVGDGQPAVEVIQRLLDQYGLEACFQPDGTYVLNRSVVDKDLGMKVPSERGKLTEIPYIHYEKKTHGLSPRPPVVEVIGKKKIQQHRVGCIAVVQDTDGIYRTLPDIEKLWKYNEGYKGSAIAWNIGVSPDKAFDDVPPGADNKNKNDALLFHSRRQILRDQAYKVFLPIGLMLDDYKPAYGGPSLPGYKPGDEEGNPTLPVSDVPIYEKQLKDLHRAIPTPTSVPEAGDVVWVPPIVSGSYFTQGLFKDFDAVQKRFDSLGTIESDLIKEYSKARTELSKWKNKFKMEQEDWKDAREASSVWGSSMLTGFTKKVKAFFGMDDTGPADAFNMATVGQRAKSYRMLAEEYKNYSKWITNLQSTLNMRKGMIKVFKGVYEKFGAMWLKYNVPHQLISSGYSIDRVSGIIKFGSPMYLVEKPFYFESETEVASRPAEVEMFYGVEANTNTKYDFTTIQVAGDTESNEVDVVGVQTLGVIPPYIMQAPTLRFAQEMDGTPMNVETVKTAALEMAKPTLSQPRDALGYNREYVGLWKIVLDMGVMSVSHEFDGDVAFTRVSINDKSKNLKPKPSKVGQMVVAHLARAVGSGPYAR